MTLGFMLHANNMLIINAPVPDVRRSSYINLIST